MHAHDCYFDTVDKTNCDAFLCALMKRAKDNVLHRSIPKLLQMTIHEKI